MHCLKRGLNKKHPFVNIPCMVMSLSSLIILISLQVWVIFILLRSHYHASTSTPSIGFISLVLGSWKEGNKPKFHPWIHNKWNLPPNWFLYYSDYKIFISGISKGFKVICTNAFSNSASAVNFLNRNLKFCLKDISPKYTWAEELHYLHQVFAKIQLWNNSFW